ncbi:DinB family protein [Mucilaginibacter sp. CAU 1740]|uniref:DinB family protein n=1 Tax=Mucilaginibacter sp. CAU 1740 TaxID=3140365 RepID=UPI00325AF087
MEKRVAGLPEAVLVSGKWSVKEHIGHLADLEPLWQGRLDDIINGSTELRATDLQNTKTDLAGHNDRPLEELLANFLGLRQNTIRLLDSLSPDDLLKSALHPRLKTPMRVTDHLLFVAEHDEHHLASIDTLIGSI